MSQIDLEEAIGRAVEPGRDPRIVKALELLAMAQNIEHRKQRGLGQMTAPERFDSDFTTINACRGEARRLCAEVHGGRWP